MKKSALGLEGLSLLVTADHRGRNNPGDPVPEADRLLVMAERVFSVTGKDVKAEPGPGFGQKIFQARVQVVQAMR